jgi:hypothetical protein
MATKSVEQWNRNSTFAKAPLGEPLFVLRAQDVLAPALVRIWAHAAAICRAPDAKVAEALAIADAMEAWPHRKVPD